MLSVGLTGAIGSGKSAVAELLVERGALLIDADQIAREVVAPGGPAYQPLLERFGPGILAVDGTIDRQALADVAFPDPATLADLNAITHPVIGKEMVARRTAAEGTDAIVVLAIPLLTEAHRQSTGLDVVVVVDAPTEVCLERLVDQRGMDRADAAARIAAQVSREERRQGADYVVDNGGDREHLAAEVARLWEWLRRRQRDPGTPGSAEEA